MEHIQQFTFPCFQMYNMIMSPYIHYLLTPGQDATIHFSSFCGVEAPPLPLATKAPPPPLAMEALPPPPLAPPHCYKKTGQLVTTG